MSPRKESEKEKEYFLQVIDQQKVDNVTVDFFYRSHTVFLLIFAFISLLIIAFTRDNLSWQDNYFHGVITVSIFFLIISTMILPNGPFTRPHPAIWRIIFGASLLYFLALVFVLFMKLEDARALLHFIDPGLKGMKHSDILNKEYAVNCTQITLSKVYNLLDIFAVAHFLGWIAKAVLLRHYGLSWLLSINWEITELAFCHILPNFRECWWDSVFLDIIICNGIGIFVGMKIVKWLEMRTYHWESIRQIQTKTGKIKRILLQFTPASWTPTCWLNSETGVKRGITLSTLVVIWQFTELNSFFLKHIFIVKPGHWLTLARLGLITLISAPALRQFYLYVTDPMVTRIGSQLWMFIAIIITEFVVCLKFGFEIFEKTILLYIVSWVFWLIFSSFATVFLCLWIANSNQGEENNNELYMLTESPTKLMQKTLKKLICRIPNSLEMEGNHNYQLYNECSCSAVDDYVNVNFSLYCRTKSE